MPAVAPLVPTAAERAKSALAFYSKQSKTSNSVQKIKKKKTKKNALNGIKKLLHTNSSSAVSNTLGIFTDKNVAVTVKKSKGFKVQDTHQVVCSATPELAKSDRKKKNNGKSTKKSPKLNDSESSKSAAVENTGNQKSVIKKCNQNGLGSKVSFAASKTGRVLSVPHKSAEVSDMPEAKALHKKVSGSFSKMIRTELKLASETKSDDLNTLKRIVSVKKTVNSEKNSTTKKSSKKLKIAPEPPTTSDEEKSTEKNLVNFINFLENKWSSSVDTKVSNPKKVNYKLQPMYKLLSTIDEITDTKQRGLNVLKLLLAPLDPSEFFKSYWESEHLLIKRKNRKYFDGLFSTKVFDNIMREQLVEFTKNLDVTSYSNGERQTHNPVGRAYPPIVWDYYGNGCSLRMLNPQTFHKPVWHVLAALQDYMGSFCGANMYLTPAGTQGFAPHWDDIEAFVLQLEGKKRWRVYKPRRKCEVLPRYSSANLAQEETGEPVLDVILNAGELLYFPRGFIHQAEAVEDSHSLHITISCNQKTTWVDLFEKMCSPQALAVAAANSVDLRKGLPMGYLGYMGKTAETYTNTGGHCSSNKNSSPTERKRDVDDQANMIAKRKEFKEQIVSLMVKSVLSDGTIDRAVDEMARQFLRVALPPQMSEDDVCCSVRGDGERWSSSGVRGRVEVDPETRVKLPGAMCVRAVRDQADASGEYRLYHSVENSREYEGREEQFVVIEDKHLPALQHLVHTYPDYTAVEDLPLPTLEDKLTVAMALWEQNILVTESSLNTVDDPPTSDSEESDMEL